jgi:hypothetical protein
MKLKITNKTIFVVLFALLYLAVGLVSTIHAVQFFGLANSPVLGTILAVTFEIGQAAVLFNLLTNPSQRKKFMPWALMCILTIVQILGNIFSSYKYLITNSNENLRFFKEPIFVWTDLPDQECNVIITYIVGAILPIVALCLTEMVVSYLGSEEESKQIEPVVEPVEETTPQEPVIEQPIIVEETKIEEPVEEQIIEEPIETVESITNEIVEEITPAPTSKPVVISEDTRQAVNELVQGGNIKQHNVGKDTKSHFINM